MTASLIQTITLAESFESGKSQEYLIPGRVQTTDIRIGGRCNLLSTAQPTTLYLYVHKIIYSQTN